MAQPMPMTVAIASPTIATRMLRPNASNIGTAMLGLDSATPNAWCGGGSRNRCDGGSTT